MICPYCTYESGPYDCGSNAKGKHGNFWQYTVPMQRDGNNHIREQTTINVYACPMCNKLFLVDSSGFVQPIFIDLF